MAQQPTVYIVYKPSDGGCLYPKISKSILTIIITTKPSSIGYNVFQRKQGGGSENGRVKS